MAKSTVDKKEEKKSRKKGGPKKSSRSSGGRKEARAEENGEAAAAERPKRKTPNAAKKKPKEEREKQAIKGAQKALRKAVKKVVRKECEKIASALLEETQKGNLRSATMMISLIEKNNGNGEGSAKHDGLTADDLPGSEEGWESESWIAQEGKPQTGAGKPETEGVQEQR
jgi:hypothetical protein